jgi:hypothetical protein
MLVTPQLVTPQDPIEGEMEVAIFGNINKGEAHYDKGFGVTFTLPRSNSPVLYSYRTKAKNESDTSTENVVDAQSIGVKEKVEQFFLDYAYLMQSLKDNEKVMIEFENSSGFWGSGSTYTVRAPVAIAETSRKEKGDASAISSAKKSYGNAMVLADELSYSPNSVATGYVMKVSDIRAFKSGKITRENAISRIKKIETSHKIESADLEVFSSIFKTLYGPQVSNTYFTNTGRLKYKRVTDLGAVFSMKVFSSNVHGKLYSIPTTGDDELTLQERNKKVKEMYPKFIAEFKENMIKYGRTVKSLEDNEALIFEINMTECDGCGLPGKVKLSINSKVLNQYDAGSIDLKSAISKISES